MVLFTVSPKGIVLRQKGATMAEQRAEATRTEKQQNLPFTSWTVGLSAGLVSVIIFLPPLLVLEVLFGGVLNSETWPVVKIVFAAVFAICAFIAYAATRIVQCLRENYKNG